MFIEKYKVIFLIRKLKQTRKKVVEKVSYMFIENLKDWFHLPLEAGGVFYCLLSFEMTNVMFGKVFFKIFTVTSCLYISWDT